VRILCVTDDKALTDRVRGEARRLKWSVDFVADLSVLAPALLQWEPEIVFLGLDDERASGWWQRNRPAGQPVVFLPNGSSEIRATFDRIERLQGQRHFPKYDLHIDSERQMARVGHRRLPLTLTEMRLLRELAAMDFDVVARDALEDCISGLGSGKGRALDVHICALRKKLKAVGLKLESVRGVGYRLNPCPA